jgi:penicillin amidase
MRNIRSIIVSLVLFGGYLYLLYLPINTSGGKLPPIGSFFNPFAGFWQNAESFDKKENLDLADLGVSNPATITFDERLVPHIFAGDDFDLALIQGYLHARYRLWQMDITARQASGRLAEVFGARLLENDKRMRRMGLAKTAENAATAWASCDDYKYLEKYVSGVNYYISHLSAKEYPAEFKLFNYQPEPWSIEKTAQVVMSMNLMLCGRNEDLAATNSLTMLGKEAFDTLYPRWNPKQSPIIPTTVKWNFDGNKNREDARSLGFRSHRMINDAPRHIGSNNWAVSARKTQEGFPILCNDPHLSLTLPSIWYELQMKSDQTNTYGVSLPGIPHIAIGFNEHVAWGETNVGMDVSDLYEIDWVDDQKTIYNLDGKEQKVTSEIETYLVNGGKPVLDTIKYTYWGPVFFEEGKSLALKWLPNLMTDNCMISSFQRLNKASDFKGYYDALRGFASPAQNFIFASQKDDIAIKVQGTFPIKESGEGQFVVDGSKSSHDWQGYISFEETPFVANPERGFVASANQNSTDTTYPYAYHGYFDDYRGRSLNQRLEKMEQLSIADMKALQNSTFDLSAAELLPILLELIKSKNNEPEWVKDLERWDCRYEANKVEPIKFDIWKHRFYDLIWDEIAAQETTQDVEMLYPEWWRTLELAKEDPQSPYFDLISTPEVEDAGDLAVYSLQESMLAYDSIVAANKATDWKTYRPVNINHLSRIPAFSETSVDVGGTSNALNSIKGTHGPSWRMIVQLSKPIKAWGVYPGGQSGNPGSAYYKNMIADWAKGAYYELHFVQKPEELTNNPLTIKIKS